MQRPGDQPPAVSENLVVLQVEIRSGLTRLAEAGLAVCGVERLSITRFALYTQARLAFVDSTHGLS